MLHPGKYTVRASTWTFKESKNNNWYLSLTFSVIVGERQDETLRSAGSRRRSGRRSSTRSR